MLGIAIPTSIAVMALGSSAAWAQSTIYTIEGSDTLTDVVKAAIAASGARLTYNNAGSGQAEKDMASLTGANLLEGIGPMSRNFVPSVLSAHPGWQPTGTNVACLDAPVVSVRATSARCKDLSVETPLTTAPISELAIILGGYPAACRNDPNIGGDRSKCLMLAVPTPAGAGNPLSPTVASKATTAECSDPVRLAALNDFVGCQKVARIDHIYRRDDKSGTQDTWREKLGFLRWCNGKSEGPTNLDNEDLDPIRTPCVASDWVTAGGKTTGSIRQTRCTYYPLTQTCTAGAADITVGGQTYSCTQGLVVAISQGDDGPDNTYAPGELPADVTQSIGRRVGNALTGFFMGLAGLGSVRDVTWLATGTTLNTISYAPSSIYPGAYLLSRRLFVQRATDIQAQIAANSSLGGQDRVDQENLLFNFVANKCSIGPICSQFGFVPPNAGPASNCTDGSASPAQSGNITYLPADSGTGTPKMNIGVGELCDGSHPCVDSGATCTAGTNLVCI
jgi:hypothetical protein